MTEETVDPEWRAGTASVRITPTEPTRMAGYAARDEPASGVEQDLFANALALEGPDGNRVVIVGADLIGFPRELSRRIASRCADACDLPRESLLLNASHTHCGPVVRSERAERNPDADPDRIAAYVETLEDAIVGVVAESLDDRCPARVGYTYARCGFAMNRRTPTDDGYRNHPYPDGPVDHDVPVLRVDDPDAAGDEDSIRAVLFGYACHNTTLSFYRYCGDWAGYAKQYLHEAHPDATPVFLTGCAGDQNPYPRRELAHAKQHGRAMANAVETALSTNARDVVGPLSIDRTHVDAEYDCVPDRVELERRLDSDDEYERGHAERLLDRIEEEGSLPETHELPVGTVRFAPDLRLVTLPGEPVVDYSLRISDELDGDVWVAGYSHESVGYVPSARVRREGGYEGERWVQYSSHPSPFAPSVEDRLVAAVHDLVDRHEPL